ncbi:MAG: alpha/beta hydrolase [Parvularculaceae bacterium]|nr:alpha/beta hydrolase [Parvularculaceae bacterium]
MATRSISDKPSMMFVAGFGDNSSMFAKLASTPLADSFDLVFFDLPGFGAPALSRPTTLESLAEVVAGEAAARQCAVIVAHSVASIVAAKAVAAPGSTLTTIFSLEGNLTAEDAYFSGTAADFDGPEPFRGAFLSRLDDMALDDPILARYRREVEKADPSALWDLGCDARAYSSARHPGQDLLATQEASYIYNPKNCPTSSKAWLAESSLPSIELPDASHWMPIDQPQQTAKAILSALS